MKIDLSPKSLLGWTWGTTLIADCIKHVNITLQDITLFCAALSVRSKCLGIISTVMSTAYPSYHTIQPPLYTNATHTNHVVPFTFSMRRITYWCFGGSICDDRGTAFYAPFQTILSGYFPRCSRVSLFANVLFLYIRRV